MKVIYNESIHKDLYDIVTEQKNGFPRAFGVCHKYKMSRACVCMKPVEAVQFSNYPSGCPYVTERALFSM